MKFVRESIEKPFILLSEVTWEDIRPLSARYVTLPNSFDSSIEVRNEEQFNKWYVNITQRYGTEGKLVEWAPNKWDIHENPKWDKKVKDANEYIEQNYYLNKRYTND